MKKQMPIPAGPGRGTIAQGYQPTIPEVAAQLAAETQSLKARLDGGDIEGEPAAYQGVRVFEPESTSFLLDVDQNGASSAPVNYVMRDGQVYDIPILTPGPGVFVGTGLTVAIFQRRYVPALPEAVEVNYNSYWSLFPRGVNYTCKFSLWPTQPAVIDDNFRNLGPSVNFFWNLLDARTGDLYADQPLNHLALRPRQSVPELNHYSRSPYLDGGMFKFDTPWVFPYGTNLIFKFQPITPVVQYDSSISNTTVPSTGLEYDDRENGRRNQAVSVKVVVHGYRMMVAPGV